MLITTKQLISSPSGLYSTYLRYGKYGMKVYKDQDVRDRCYGLQRYLHNIGLAPYCHFCMEFTGPNGNMLYAFWTDHAECYEDDESYDWWDNEAKKLAKSILEKTGFSWIDGHKGNVGFIDGRRVCIDCDPVYFYTGNSGKLNTEDYRE